MNIISARYTNEKKDLIRIIYEGQEGATFFPVNDDSKETRVYKDLIEWSEQDGNSIEDYIPPPPPPKTYTVQEIRDLFTKAQTLKVLKQRVPGNDIDYFLFLLETRVEEINPTVGTFKDAAEKLVELGLASAKLIKIISTPKE